MLICSIVLFNVCQSFLRHRFCVPGKDLYWFTDKEIESNVSEFCVKDSIILITVGKVNCSNPSSHYRE